LRIRAILVHDLLLRAALFDEHSQLRFPIFGFYELDLAPVHGNRFSLGWWLDQILIERQLDDSGRASP
jgi:hypothetical protein